jgi:hypothetical protein
MSSTPGAVRKNIQAEGFWDLDDRPWAQINYSREPRWLT